MAMASARAQFQSFPDPEISHDELAPKRVDEWRPGDALLLEVTDEPHDGFAAAPRIAIEFPAFSDGRGLSLAVLLRTRHGFSGELTAVGAVNREVVHYLVRCGFDSIELPDGERLRADDVTHGSTLAPYSDYYQASVLEPQPAYRRTRRGA